jgi:hypothetical protein
VTVTVCSARRSAARSLAVARRVCESDGIRALQGEWPPTGRTLDRAVEKQYRIPVPCSCSSGVSYFSVPLPSRSGGPPARGGGSAAFLSAAAQRCRLATTGPPQQRLALPPAARGRHAQAAASPHPFMLSLQAPPPPHRIPPLLSDAKGACGRSMREEHAGGASGRSMREEHAGGACGRSMREEHAGGARGRAQWLTPAHRRCADTQQPRSCCSGWPYGAETIPY